MRCLIPSPNVKILARALHSLARIGDDLFVEFKTDGLALRTVNSAQSAYSTFTFNYCFFSTFKTSVSDDFVKCKISIKSCLTVFKTPHAMDKNVESCQIQVNDDCSQLIFQIKYVKGHTKTHFVPVLDNENIQLRYSKDDMPNTLTIVSKYLSNAVKHFRNQDDEITFSVTKQKAYLKNYYENSDDKKTLRTELCLQSGDFELYSIKTAVSITFSLKELRAVILFSELANFPVGIYFENAGRPVIFTINNDPVYEANYVISTLPPDFMSEDGTPRSVLTDNISTIPSAVNANKSLVTRVEPDVENVYNLSSTTVNELLNSCPDAVVNEYTTPVADDPVSDNDIVRIQKIRNIFRRCLDDSQRDSIPVADNVLVYDSEGIMDSD